MSTGKRPTRSDKETAEINALVDAAVARYRALSPEDKEAHDKAQRESWIRAMQPTGDPRLD